MRLPIVLSMSVVLASRVAFGTSVTFDEIIDPTHGDGVSITNNYQNLIWNNFAVVNAVVYTGLNGSNGYFNGMVSISNVALNAYGAPAEIDSFTNFNFFSVYLTGAFNSNLNIVVEGFRAGSMLYSQTVVASATSPILFTFDYINIDRLTFSAFGGQPAGFPVAGGSGDSHFAMDNFTFEFVPEPSPLVLTAAGALLLWPLLKRKRAN